jgi:hypothetical protein
MKFQEPLIMTTEEKLDDIIKRLERIEGRQIRTTAMVEEVEKHEAPVVGSFGSTDTGTKPE